jgi:hypothetical protein
MSSNTPQNQGTSNKTLWIVLAVVGGVMVFCCLFGVIGMVAIATIGSNANGTFQPVATKVGPR